MYHEGPPSRIGTMPRPSDKPGHRSQNALAMDRDTAYDDRRPSHRPCQVVKRHDPAGPQARALVAAQDRLASKPGYTRARAAAILLPDQSPSSAARYLRKLRSGERTGRVIIERPSVARRVAIFAPRRLGEIPRVGGPFWATVYVDTSCGPKAANAQVPRQGMTAREFMAHPSYPHWVATVEARWLRVLNYACKILRVTKVRDRGGASIRKVAVELRPVAA